MAVFEIEIEINGKPEVLEIETEGDTPPTETEIITYLEQNPLKEAPVLKESEKEKEENFAQKLINFIAPAILPTVGAVGGAAVGNVWGGIPAAMGGAALGQSANQAIANLMGKQKGYDATQAAVEAGLTGVIPVAGAGVKAVAPAVKNTILDPIGRVVLSASRVPAETFNRAIQPGSKALDLTKDQARQLLRDKTEYIQEAYKAILNSLGQDVNKAVTGLKGTKKNINPKSLRKDVESVFEQYQPGNIVNPAENLASKEKNMLMRLIDEAAQKEGGKVIESPILDQYGNKITKQIPSSEKRINPVEVQGILNQIKEMVNWADESSKLKNEILEQVYGRHSSRIKQISPEYEEAMKAFENAAKMQKKESLRSILQPKKEAGDSIDTAASQLKNITGFTRANREKAVEELEEFLVKSGNERFLDDIHDINAAEILGREITTGDSGVSALIREITTKPALRLIKNTKPGIEKILKMFNPELQAGLSAGAGGLIAPTLTGGVEENVYNY